MASKNALIFIFITIVIDSTGLGIIIPTTEAPNNTITKERQKNEKK